jgi:hypothetical protein
MTEGKQTLAGLQRHLIQTQVEDHCRERRRCSHCGLQRPVKDIGRWRLLSLFGTVEVCSPPTPSKAPPSITLSIYGGHVRSVRSYQMRSFEILLAQVNNQDGDQGSAVCRESARQREQLRNVPQTLGATPTTPVRDLERWRRGTSFSW